MSGFLLTLHVIVSVLLVAVILLQPGAKGGGLGASFGGGGGANTAFGAQGSAPFLAKLTYYLAAVVMGTSLVIEIVIVKENRSVLDRSVAPLTLAVPKPAVPAAPLPASPSAPASVPAPGSAPAPAVPPSAPKK